MESDFIKRRGKTLMCEMCGKKLATEQCATDHVNGKKHRRLVSMKHTREEQSQRSIFIGNLRKTTSELELTGHFSKFGPVAKVIIDKEKSSYAILEFASPESALKATQEEKQVMNGLHITVRPREVREFVASGIKQRNAALERGRKKEEQVLLESDNLTLMLMGKIADQMDALMRATRLSEASQKLRYLICDLLREVFSEFFPNCRVYPYGSSVNGCGREGSDLDIFLSLNWIDQDWKYRFASPKRETAGSSKEGSPSPQSTEDTLMEEEGDAGLPDPDLASGKEALQFVADILQKCAPSCHKVQVIASARKPVVKFIHADSGLHCDIILNNRLSLRNTELVHFYCSLCPLVQPLVFLVRRWGKIHHISENVGPGPRLSNYALTWIVIFFLQTKGILPTVKELRQKAGAADKLTIDGWDCSLCMDKDLLQAKEDYTPEQILKDFFEYYAHLDWSSNCLCPATGNLAKVADMALVKSPSSEGTFKTGPVNIQDPLELTHNIAANVNEKTAKIISQAFTKAVEACSSETFLTKATRPEGGTETTPWGVCLLVMSNQKESPVKTPSHSSGTYDLNFELKKTQISEEFAAKFVDPREMDATCAERMETFLMDVLRDTLALSCTRIGKATGGTKAGISEEERAESSMDVDEGDLQGTTNATSEGDCQLGVAGKNLRPIEGAVDASQETAEPPPKKQRVEEPGKGNKGTTEAVTSVYSCRLYHEVWVGRRKARRTLQKQGVDSRGLALEKLVTEKSILDSAGATKKGESIVEFSMEVRRDPERGAVRLTMLPLKGEGPFKLFHHFLGGFLSKSVDDLKF